MSDVIVTVDQAAEALRLHPKTVLRHIREGRLAATRVGKSYRITRTALDSFAGIASGNATNERARATCIVDLPDMPVDAASRMTAFLQSAALTGTEQTPALGLQTAYDPAANSLKLVIIGVPADVARLLEMIELHLGRKA